MLLRNLRWRHTVTAVTRKRGAVCVSGSKVSGIVILFPVGDECKAVRGERAPKCLLIPGDQKGVD